MNLLKRKGRDSILSIYLLDGEETYLLESKLKKIKKEFGEMIKGINFIQIDEENVSEIISDIETPAFGYPTKLIIARNTGLFKKEKRTAKGKSSKSDQAEDKKKSVSLSDKIAEYIEENKNIFNEDVTLVFVEEEADKNNLYKAVEKIGEVIHFELLKLPQLIDNIKKICGAYKVNIDNETAKYFVECCGTNMQELINEIRKLIEYAGQNGTIKKEDIDKLSIKQLESVIFDLTDNLGKRNISKSLQVLNNLIYAKEPIQKILITLYNHFKKLYIVKMSEKYKKDLATAMNLKPSQMFLTSKYKAQARYFETRELRSILQELMDLDANYKSGLIDLNIGLEAILCRYCS